MRRSKEWLLIILLIFFFCFCNIPSSATPFADFLPLDNSQGNIKHKAGGHEDSNNNYHHGLSDDTSIAHKNKFGHATSGEGGSHSPYVPGGGGVVPVYAAGAANNHHNHRHTSGANCGYGLIGSKAFVITILAYFVLFTPD